LVNFHPTVSVVLCCTFAVGTLLDLVLAFGVHEGTSDHTAVSGHLLGAVVALGYIPWSESAVVVYCKVVVCDNLFGLVL